MKKLLFFILLLAVKQVDAQLCFDPVANYKSGSHSSSVTDADFNGDGFIDLAVTNSYSFKLAVLLGNGMGSFASAISYTTGSSPQCITHADFNNDGFIDLVTGNAGSNNVTVLLGTGTGSFGAPIAFTLGPIPCGIISADFNADGKADVAVAICSSDNVHVLLGTGTGSFVADTYFSLGKGSNTGMVSGNFDGDAIIDLAASNASGVSVLLGVGNGTFGSASNFVSLTYPTSIVTADFNGDSYTDLALANETSTDSVAILLGTGTGSFVTTASFTVSAHVFSISSADFNADTKADLAVATSQPGNGKVAVFLGSGAGTFTTSANFVVSGGPQSMISADFNKDGYADLATANWDSANVSILLNCVASEGINQVALNKDQVSLYPNPANGQLTIETNVTSPQSVQVFDINGRPLWNKTISGTTRIDVSTLPEGVYTVVIKSSARVITKKLIIVK